MASYPVNILRSVGRPTNLEKALEAYALEVAHWAQNWMIAHDKIATGDSIRSFEILVLKNEIVLTSAPSVGYALQGRGPGKFPDVAEIERWVMAKPITPYPGADGKIPTLGQLVFLISRKIAQEGTDPPKLQPQNIAMAVNSLANKYLNRIGEEQADEMRADFVNTFNRANAYK